MIQDLTAHFTTFRIAHIPRIQNASSDLLTNVASKLIPPDDFNPDRFSIELIFRCSIPDNVTNWCVFNDDDDILSFLTSKGSYFDQLISEYEHDKMQNRSSDENNLPKPVVKLEDLYDLKDRFKRTTN